MSCFKCPYASSEKINFYDHQQNKMENGQIKPKTTEDKVDEVIDGTKEKIIIRIFGKYLMWRTLNGKLY